MTQVFKADGPLQVDADGNLLVAIKGLEGAQKVSVDLIATAEVTMVAGANKDLYVGAASPGEGKQVWLLGITCTADADGSIQYHDDSADLDTNRSGLMSIMALSGHVAGYSGNVYHPFIKFGTNQKPQADLVTSNIGGACTFAIVTLL